MASKTKPRGTAPQGDVVKELNLTFEQLMAEVEKCRAGLNYSVLTYEQKRFITACRDCLPQVTYQKMAELWGRAGWGKVNRTTLQEWYRKMKERG